MDFVNDNMRDILERLRIINKPHKKNAGCHEKNLCLCGADD